MIRIQCLAFVYFLVCTSSVICDRSDDCNVIALQAAENDFRMELDTFITGSIAPFSSDIERLNTKCRQYDQWRTAIDEIYDDCQHYAHVSTFNHEAYIRTIAVYELICDTKDDYHKHKICLRQTAPQIALLTCINVFWTKYQDLVADEEPMSTIHDSGCDYLDDAIDCVYNASNRFCNSSAAEYYEDYFRAYIEPWMLMWNCQFDRSWGWIITTGILIAVLAFIALLWAAFFLCCRYCCDCDICPCCCGGAFSDGRRRRYSNSDVHPMERY